MTNNRIVITSNLSYSFFLILGFCERHPTLVVELNHIEMTIVLCFVHVAMGGSL